MRRAVVEGLEVRLFLSAGLFTSDQDIGAPGQPGSAGYANGVYTITGGGAGIGENPDEFNFAYEASSGNSTLIAKINSFNNNTNSYAQAGEMIRSDTTGVAAFAGIFITPGTGVEFISRASENGSAVQKTTLGIQVPEYLELVISGSTITGSYSSNGSTWTTMSSSSVTLGATPLIGIAVSAYNNSSTETANISSVDILPGGWSDSDIGSPPLAGSASYNATANSFTLSGGGTGVGGAADQLNIANYAMTGDGSITALLNSQTGTDPGAKAGVMIRADTTSGSMFAAVDQTSANVIAFEWRSGVTASISSTVTIGGSIWLRVSDQGNNFTGYYSTDGANWTQIGSTQSISMPSATVLSGVWTSSNNSSALNTAQFSDVSLVRGGWSDADIGAPPIGGAADYDAPSDTTTIWGNGADIYGTSEQFNFDSTTMTGDGSAIAYVDSITNTNAWAKAGVMIRSDSTAASPFAALLVSPTNGITFEYWVSAGVTNQEISSPAGGPTPAPVGLKLTRAGNVFSAFYSTDGVNWISVGASQTVAINSSALAGLAVTSHNTAALCTATFSSVSIGNSPPPGAGIYSSSDQLFLNSLENAEVLAFYNEASPTTGLVPDNESANGGGDSADASIAAIGFALSALTIGDARGWLSHSVAYQRALTTINFLYNSGANNNGFFYHFLTSTGARYGTSEVSSVDTAELMAGVLNAAQYWAGTPLQTTALAMFNRVNWPWMQQSSGVFYGAWTPESGFSGGYGDYSEASLLYLMALGSPTHPITEASWLAWTRTPVETYSTYKYVDADDNALFTVQEPQAWFNLQGLTDAKGLSYYSNAQTATLAQRQWMINLNSSYSDYNANLWGLTPAEGASGYTIWGGPPANVPVNGTVVPAAAGGSLEFEPRYSVNVLENMKQTYGSTLNVYQKYGLVDAFNPLTNWVSSLVLGIDIGMMLLSAENSRSNLIWNWFDQNAVAQEALAKAFQSTSATSVWIASGSGNLSTNTNWENNVSPNSIGAAAEFFGTTGTAYNVYADAPVTAGTLDFVNSASYVIDGAGSLTLQASSGNAQIIVSQGTQEIDLPTTIASNTTFNVATGATLIIANPLTINSGITLTQTGGGTVTYESIINLQSGASIVFGNSTVAVGLDVQDDASASMALNTTPTPMILQLDSLSLSGRLDVTNGDLIVDDGNLSTITGELKAGFNAGYGYWNGARGIVSSAAAADATHLMTLGSSQSSGTPFDGVNTTASDVLVKYTYYGDANLDGMVNGADYQQIDNGFGEHLSGWQNGDFNYDGVIDGSDFSLIDNTFNQLHASADFQIAPTTIIPAASKASATHFAIAPTSSATMNGNTNAPSTNGSGDENPAAALVDMGADDPRKHHNPIWHR